MKLLSRILGALCFSSTILAQFHAPDTEYHDPIQRVFPIEAARVLVWLNAIDRDPQVQELTYKVLTRPDQSTTWEIASLDADGKSLRSVKVAYPKSLLDSGAQFYREVFAQLWRAGLCDRGLSTTKADEIVENFWKGGDMAGLGREESLTNALRLTLNFPPTLAGRNGATLAGLMLHGALPSLADQITLDCMVIARAAAWLAIAEQSSAAKLDRLWAPVLFMSNRDQIASTLWQKESASTPGATVSERFWNLALRGASTREAYLFAAERKNLTHGLALLSYDLHVNQSRKLLGDLFVQLCQSQAELVRAHNYAPLMATHTTVGGGHVMDGAWAFYSRVACAEVFRSFPTNTPDLYLLGKTLDVAREATSKLRAKEFEGDASLYGLKEIAPFLRLAHQEGVGKLRPCGVLTVRDAMNHAWEVAGLQIGARYIFVNNRWGVGEQGAQIWREALSAVGGWLPLFAREEYARSTTYSESLLRLQMVDAKFERVGWSPNPFGKNLSPDEAMGLWAKRSWLRPREFEWQARTMWDAEQITEIPIFAQALHERGGARAAAAVLDYLRKINPANLKEIPKVENLKYSLADSLPQPTKLYVRSIDSRDIAGLEPFERGRKLEEFFWRSSDEELQTVVVSAYLSHPAYKAAKRFYLRTRTSITDPVAFSNNGGNLLWLVGFFTNDPELRRMSLEDSRSGSFSDMIINLWEHAFNDDLTAMESQVDELIERYESDDGKDSLGRLLQRFLPLAPALKDLKHPKRAEALRHFGRAPGWISLRWIWIQKYRMPANDAITFLGDRETDHLRDVLIAVIDKDQPGALEKINSYFAAHPTISEKTLIAQDAYGKLHPHRPEPDAPDLKPKDFEFTREIVLKKLGRNSRTE
jgi:hypothetical protein